MRVVCFGDSLTACGGENGRYGDVLQDRFPGHAFINRGAGGETFVDALARFDADVAAERPDVVLVEFGANDWWKDERPHAAWAADLEQIVTRVRQAGARCVVLGVFGPYLDAAGRRAEKSYGADDRSRAYREAEEAIARRHGCGYVANIQERIVGNRLCWRDRNHPNEFGNRHVADAIEPALAPLLGSAPGTVRRPTLQTTRDMWDEAVALSPAKLAVVDGDRRLTYAEADRLVQQLAANLWCACGQTPPKVALFLPNCLEYYLVYWAIVRLGGAIVPLNTWLKEDNIASIFANVKPQVLIVRSRFDSVPLKATRTAAVPNVFALDPAGSDLRPYASLLGEAEPTPRRPIGADDVSIIMHTSGTTAAPKGGMMRHSDLMFNVMAAINAHQFRPSDVHLLINPMFHCTALYSSLPTAAYQKSTIVITADANPDSLMRVVQKERVTTFLSVPSIFQRIVALPDLHSYDYSALRLIAYAGSPMPVSTIRRLQEHVPGVDLHNFFGLTETISMTHVLLGEEAVERPDSIGRLLPFVYAKVVDPDTLAERPAGQVGELLFARSNVIPGYYNQPDKLDQAMVTLDGRPWFRTGDLAVVDEEGYFFVKGRQKDMIIVGGENVFAAEVEAFLMTHDKVKEAAVKGVPATGIRESLGELIKAYVVRGDPSLTETEVRRYCMTKLASFKVPHIIVFMDDLPRNPAGKLVKADLP